MIVNKEDAGYYTAQYPGEVEYIIHRDLDEVQVFAQGACFSLTIAEFRSGVLDNMDRLDANYGV